MAIRRELEKLDLNAGAHAGLLLNRYLKVAVGNNEAAQTARKNLQTAARGAVSKAHGVYQRAYERWKASLPVPYAQAELAVQGRLIVGLGVENVLEAGLRLHHTYGVPLIPGSALKGLAAHFASRVWGLAEKEWLLTGDVRNPHQGAFHREVFGAQDEGGHLVFHDAWILPHALIGGEHTGILSDVLTTHHGNYYMQKDDLGPTDFDDPNPVTFLSVTGTFLVAVSCDVNGDEGQAWANLTLELLKEALKAWGVGGKTSSGYGRLGEAGPKVSENCVGAPTAPIAPQSTLRARGTKAKVKILKKRKNGYNVEDQDFPNKKGALTLGNPPNDLSPGQVVDVEVADEKISQLQYKWPEPSRETGAGKAKDGTGDKGPKKGKHKKGGRG